MRTPVLKLTRGPLTDAPQWLRRSAAERGDELTIEQARDIIAAGIIIRAVPVYEAAGLSVRLVDGSEIEGAAIDWETGSLRHHARACGTFKSIAIELEEGGPLECDLLALADHYQRCRLDPLLAPGAGAAPRGRPAKHPWEDIAAVMAAIAINEGIWHDAAALARRTLDHIAEIYAEVPDARDVRRRADKVCELVARLIEAPGK